jgi:hypothetical protein
MSVKITDKTEDCQRRTAIKQVTTQLKNLVTAGCGISDWEASTLVKVVEEIFLDNPALKAIQPGQMPFLCVSAKEGAGKPLKSCQMVQVLLTPNSHPLRIYVIIQAWQLAFSCFSYILFSI